MVKAHPPYSKRVRLFYAEKKQIETKECDVARDLCDVHQHWLGRLVWTAGTCQLVRCEFFLDISCEIAIDVCRFVLRRGRFEQGVGVRGDEGCLWPRLL